MVGRAEEGEGDAGGEGRKMGLSETFRVGGIGLVSPPTVALQCAHH